MQAQPQRVVRTITSNAIRGGQLRNSVVEWRDQAGARAAEILNSENNLAPEVVPPRHQFAIASVLIAVAVLMYAAHKLGLV